MMVDWIGFTFKTEIPIVCEFVLEGIGVGSFTAKADHQGATGRYGANALRIIYALTAEMDFLLYIAMAATENGKDACLS